MRSKNPIPVDISPSSWWKGGGAALSLSVTITQGGSQLHDVFIVHNWDETLLFLVPSKMISILKK